MLDSYLYEPSILDETPKEEGGRERQAGIPRYKNPHPVLTEEHDEWNAGHLGPDYWDDEDDYWKDYDYWDGE